jgi:hypothetical protein
MKKFIATKPPADPHSLKIKVQEKKYSKDHEWIELSEDGKLGTCFPPILVPVPFPHKPI